MLLKYITAPTINNVFILPVCWGLTSCSFRLKQISILLKYITTIGAGKSSNGIVSVGTCMDNNISVVNFTYAI